METKTRLSLTTPLLLIQISLKYRLLVKTNIIEVIKKVIQLLELMPLRLSRKTKIRPRIKVILNITPANRRITISVNVPES